jgi:hypothetical protein
MAVDPALVQPVKLPVSKPPLTMGFGGGGAVTVNVTVVLCVADGAVPLTVSVDVPVAALLETTIDSVELPPVVTEVGLRVAVTPVGAPLTLRLIVSAEPLTSVVEIVLVPDPPCAIDKLEGFAEIEKSFVTGLVTTSCTFVECVGVPPG